MRVEGATSNDVRGWLALAAEVGELFGTDMATDPQYRVWLEKNIARGTAFCVRRNGELVGAMQFRDGEIGWLAVATRYRGRGIGRALVEHAIASGVPEVRVTTFGEGHPNPDAEAARIMYRRLGFQKSSLEPDQPPDGTVREVLVWRRGDLGGESP